LRKCRFVGSGWSKKEQMKESKKYLTEKVNFNEHLILVVHFSTEKKFVAICNFKILNFNRIVKKNNKAGCHWLML
jgi:hypothetical protein